MFELLFSYIVLFGLLGVAVFFDTFYLRKHTPNLGEQVCVELANMADPVYWDATLLLKLGKKLKKDSLLVSECMYILERQGKLHKSYQNNRRIVSAKSLHALPGEEDMPTLVIIGNTLYMESDDSKSWSRYDNWTIKLQTYSN
tara:strand:- start:1915 stop:2343 length:429 start_codon:yes stop_codon:yes gene_type:complete